MSTPSNRRRVHVYVAMVVGDIGDGQDVLVRLHSECLTGDALGSLRCDCGVQLRLAMRMLAAEQRGVLIYATGHEGRGHRSRQQAARLRRPGRRRRHRRRQPRARPARRLPRLHRGGRRARRARRPLDPPADEQPAQGRPGCASAGTVVNAVVPLPTSPHHRNLGYLNTKAERMGHVRPTATRSRVRPERAPGRRDGAARPRAPRPDRPFVVLKYAQNARRAHRHLDRRRPVDQRRGESGACRTPSGPPATP